MLIVQSPGIYGFSFIWFGHNTFLYVLENCSFHVWEFKSAPNMLQTIRQKMGVWFTELKKMLTENLVYPQDLLCIILE